MQGPSGRHGQNGFGGWGGQWRAEQAVQAWYDEVKDYNFSYGGFAMNTGHFTQLVWRETVKVQSFDIPNKKNICTETSDGRWGWPAPAVVTTSSPITSRPATCR